MNYDASSLPPSLIPDCEPRLSGSTQSDETIRGLFDTGLHGLWRPREVGDARPRSIAPPATGRGRLRHFVKRACDCAIASLALLVLWPPMLLIAILIRLDSKGPVFFRQCRLGQGGREFWVLKY